MHLKIALETLLYTQEVPKCMCEQLNDCPKNYYKINFFVGCTQFLLWRPGKFSEKFSAGFDSSAKSADRSDLLINFTFAGTLIVRNWLIPQKIYFILIFRAMIQLHSGKIS